MIPPLHSPSTGTAMFLLPELTASEAHHMILQLLNMTLVANSSGWYVSMVRVPILTPLRLWLLMLKIIFMSPDTVLEKRPPMIT